MIAELPREIQFRKVNMGRRTGVIGVRQDALLLVSKGVFGENRKRWERPEIAAIRTGPSGMAVGGQPVYELQIHPRQGRKFGFLRGQSRAEQEWIADLLRQDLGVPAA